MKVRGFYIRKFIKYWLPIIFLMCFISWMSTETFSAENTSSVVEAVVTFLVPAISSQELNLVHALIRKAAHVTEYFIMGLLLFRAFRGDSNVPWKWRWASFALIVVILWAATDEFHQSFVPTRAASAVDIGIDTAGGMLAQLVSALWHRYRIKRMSRLFFHSTSNP
jgi:VanZ family protein